jgi:CTP:molybdopterin cytidylyltransferase MocA
VPLLRRTAQTLLASGLREVITVLGHEAESCEGCSPACHCG